MPGQWCIVRVENLAARKLGNSRDERRGWFLRGSAAALLVYTLMKNLIHKSFPVASLKMDEEQGIIEAIVSVTANKDRGGERVMPGFFAKSLTGKLPRGVWCHDWTMPIAKTLVAEEWAAGDSRLPEQLRDFGGYYIKGQFNLETQRGREAYSDLKFGTIDEFSIGFAVSKSQKNPTTKTLDLIEGEWFEWSPVLVGMNPATSLLNIKSAETPAATPKLKGQYLGDYIESSMTMGAVDRVINAVWWLMVDAIYDDLSIEDRLAMVAGGFDEARDLTLKVIQAILSGESSDTPEMAVKFIESITLKSTDEQSLRAGLTLARHSEQVLAAAKELQTRINNVHALRVKEGRVLSTANRQTIKDLADQAGTIREKLMELYDATDPNAEKSAAESDRLFAEYLFLNAQLSAIGV